MIDLGIWQPSHEIIEQSNLYEAMMDLGINNYVGLYNFSTVEREHFWDYVVQKLEIKFNHEVSPILRSDGLQNQWFLGAQLNIVESCFKAPEDKLALIYGSDADDMLRQYTYGELKKKCLEVVAGFEGLGLVKGDRVCICMPMNFESVALYLACVYSGVVAVTAAESFSVEQVSLRAQIGEAKYLFTSESVVRGDGSLKLYDRLKSIDLPAIVQMRENKSQLKDGDVSWESFLGEAGDFSPVSCATEEMMTLLFSSGTTGEPKAIPWTHLTPIKSASDGFFHQDIHAHDVVAWPTSLGWMMGPWLIFASLMNNASMALYEGSPTQGPFLDFVKASKVSVLGLVPAIISAWRHLDEECKDQLAGVRLFSTTGEASNRDDVTWLMKTAGSKPVIEYCGGTEIGGGYVTGSILQPQKAACFSTPALGSVFCVLDEAGNKSDEGELFLYPYSLGLSQSLVNADHEKVYFEGVAELDGVQLRRHGDCVKLQGDGFIQPRGRADDTMNLSGIKVSPVAFEQLLVQLDGIAECAAVSQRNSKGEQLYVFYKEAVGEATLSRDELLAKVNELIAEKLNPLYSAKALVRLTELPRTASNKVMRRKLRKLLAEL